MEIAPEALRNGHADLNAASLPYPLRKYTCRDTSMGNIQIIEERELVNLFAIGTIHVLYNHHLFTNSGF
jgi:hypothetical protein